MYFIVIGNIDLTMSLYGKKVSKQRTQQCI